MSHSGGKKSYILLNRVIIIIGWTLLSKITDTRSTTLVSDSFRQGRS